MAISFTDSSGVAAAGAMPSAPTFFRSARMTFAAADVYVPGGLNVAAALAAAFPGHTIQGAGMVKDLAGATVRYFELKTGAVAGMAYTGEDGTDGTETWNLTDGDTIVVSVDGGANQTATFEVADFVNIDAATAAEIVAVLTADIAGATAAADANNRVTLTSDTTGAASSINIVSVTGTATELHFDTGVAAHHTGTAAGTPRVFVVEETAGVLGEVLSNTDLSAHSTVDLPIISQ